MTLVTVLAVTLFWVAHNLRIHRRKGPRTELLHVAERYDRDWEGRSVEAEWEQVRAGALVLIDIDGDRKFFRPSDLAG